MKVSVVISALFLLGSCNEGRHTAPSAVKINYFDSVEEIKIRLLDSLQLSQFNDTSKWLLYTIQCDDSSEIGRNKDRKILSKIPLGFLKLKLNYVEIKNDTLSLLYYFLHDDSTTVERSTAKEPIRGGMQFDTKNTKIIGYIVGEAVLDPTRQPSSRYRNLLDPEVEAFIKNNKDKLNPWFREEAMRREIIH